ncbi:MAG: thioredoxin family protein [Candidatus Amulumruptor caecigallinarius]|nr:thioredoxin family protein [Candidatus Amulumruptor caecigallinarius]
MKRIIPFFLVAFTALVSMAADQVTWSYRIVGDNTGNPALEMTAVVAPGFHMYAQDNPVGGGVPLTFHMDFKGCKADGPVKAGKAYTKAYDDVLMVDEHYYTGTVKFTQKIKPAAESWSVKVEIGGQVCDDSGCFRIVEGHQFKGTAPLTDAVKEEAKKLEEEKKAAADSTVNGITEMTDSLQSSESLLNPGVNISGVNTDKWWANCEAEMRVFEQAPDQQSRSLWYIFIAGFIGGLIALVTPCVWPMIPMTVSFFLKSNKSRRKSIMNAVVYGLSIIVIYVALGLIVTGLFGASALNELATSAGFNIAFFILLVIFAVSFMGGFELTLPAKWSNKIDSKVDTTTGYLSIFFMAFTLCLVSFSCTGPIIGTLLVEAAATSNFISPAIGMFGFALALALPFSLFAIFPTMLKSIPKSGGWMNTVKVVLGFLELALALKFLSVADLAYGWRILDREVFIALWIVIFALLGVYLLGKITLPHDDKVERIGVTRFMLALVSISFAIYMIPGLWGAPLKSISAFAPPIYTQDFNLYTGDVHAQTDNYEEGMALAAKLNKPVLVDFSGYGCVNCRKMEAAVLTNTDIKNMIDNDFVMITLMVDDKKPLPQPIVVKETNGVERTLRTYGDKWSYLQRTKFGANAQPYYVILNNEGEPLNKSFPYEENVPKYLQFLTTGLENYLKK